MESDKKEECINAWGELACHDSLSFFDGNWSVMFEAAGNWDKLVLLESWQGRQEYFLDFVPETIRPFFDTAVYEGGWERCKVVAAVIGFPAAMKIDVRWYLTWIDDNDDFYWGTVCDRRGRKVLSAPNQDPFELVVQLVNGDAFLSRADQLQPQIQW